MSLLNGQSLKLVNKCTGGGRSRSQDNKTARVEKAEVVNTEGNGREQK